MIKLKKIVYETFRTRPGTPDNVINFMHKVVFYHKKFGGKDDDNIVSTMQMPFPNMMLWVIYNPKNPNNFNIIYNNEEQYWMMKSNTENKNIPINDLDHYAYVWDDMTEKK